MGGRQKGVCQVILIPYRGERESVAGSGKAASPFSQCFLFLSIHTRVKTERNREGGQERRGGGFEPLREFSPFRPLLCFLCPFCILRGKGKRRGGRPEPMLSFSRTLSLSPAPSLLVFLSACLPLSVSPSGGDDARAPAKAFPPRRLCSVS